MIQMLLCGIVRANKKKKTGFFWIKRKKVFEWFLREFTNEFFSLIFLLHRKCNDLKVFIGNIFFI